MKINLHARVDVPASAEQAFALVTDPDRFPEFFPGNLLVPAVLAVELQGEPPPAPGMLRLVRNADGSCMTERVEKFEPPREHRYGLIAGFVPPANWLIREAEAVWRVEPRGGGSRIDWHYAFQLRHPLAALLAWPTLGVFFGRAMRHCLQAMGEELGARRSAG